jgi:hypothetical protein
MVGPFFFRQGAAVNEREYLRGVVVHHLDELVTDLAEYAAKDFVPANYCLKALLESVDAERARETEAIRNVVSCHPWFESIFKPETLLAA